ncbi:Plasma membrane calcium-transporting ATPase 4 [Lucilia cuprina]|nr:Plasma membrane calcium-transporting ATPase 4 [Lucilia cuprina]
MSSLVPLRIRSYSLNPSSSSIENSFEDIWINTTPGSKNFCRPIKLEYIKESKKATKDLVEYLKDEINALEPICIKIKEFSINVSYQLSLTMIDGKLDEEIADKFNDMLKKENQHIATILPNASPKRLKRIVESVPTPTSQSNFTEEEAIALMLWGRGHPEEYTDGMNLGEERFDSIDSDKKPRAGQILWIRGLTRLQTQLRVIRAFKSNLEDLNERRSMHSLHSLRSPRTANFAYGGFSNSLSPTINNKNFTLSSINNNKKFTQTPQQPLQQAQQSKQQNPLQLPVDMIYIDEDPTTQKYQKTNGRNDAAYAGPSEGEHGNSQEKPEEQKALHDRIYTSTQHTSPIETVQSETRF